MEGLTDVMRLSLAGLQAKPAQQENLSPFFRKSQLKENPPAGFHFTPPSDAGKIVL
jgi:hypothetical protein